MSEKHTLANERKVLEVAETWMAESMLPPPNRSEFFCGALVLTWVDAGGAVMSVEASRPKMQAKFYTGTVEGSSDPCVCMEVTMDWSSHTSFSRLNDGGYGPFYMTPALASRFFSRLGQNEDG